MNIIKIVLQNNAFRKFIKGKQFKIYFILEIERINVKNSFIVFIFF